MYRYMLRKKGRILLFLVLLVVSCVMGSLFSLVMSALVDCAGKTAEELFWTLLGSVVYVVVYNLSALSYRCMKAGILTDARYYLKKDVFTSLMGRTVGDFDVGNSAEYMNELSSNLYRSAAGLTGFDDNSGIVIHGGDQIDHSSP